MCTRKIFSLIRPGTGNGINLPMPANIEIKARIHNPAAFQALAESLSDTSVATIRQEDIFFAIAHGRLKLRILARDHGQLIYYTRPDTAGPKRSEYRIYETSKPEEMKSLLLNALGVRGIVRKTRYLYLVGQTRIHMDEVEALGTFAELEVVLRPGQQDREGLAIAENLLAKLGIPQDDWIEGAYIDLLERSRKYTGKIQGPRY